MSRLWWMGVACMGVALPVAAQVLPPSGGGSSGVSSFNTRTGAVVSQTGDYTASQVGALSSTGPVVLPNGSTATTQGPLDNSTNLGTTAYADLAVGVETTRATAAEALACPKTGCTFTGATVLYSNTTATTQTTGDTSTDVATDAFAVNTIAAQSCLLAGCTMTGNLAMGTHNITGTGSISGLTGSFLTPLAIGTNIGAGSTVNLNAAAGSTRQVVYQSAGVSRWAAITQSDAESSSVATTANGAVTASTTLVVTSGTGIVNGMSVGGTGNATAPLVVSGGGTTTLVLTSAITVANGAALTFYPNAGSSFSARAYDDGGNPLFTGLSWSRASGGALTLGTNNYGPVVVASGPTSVAGNARGTGAFDGQQNRTAAAQVASGAYSATFGENNNASGTAGFVVGVNNTNSNGASFVSGSNATDRGRYTSTAFSSGISSTQGDTQTAFGILRANSTTGAGARMTADGNAASSANCWDIPSSTAYLLRIDIMGWTSSGVLAVSYQERARLKRGVSVGTTVISNTTITADSDNDTITGLTAPTIAADTTNGCITLTSGFATSATMRWGARVLSAMELQ